MTTPPEFSSTQFELADPTAEQISDLEAGLNAFKRGDFASAIALLETAFSTPPAHPLTVKGQMGLAIAYEKLGETLPAAQVCQLLTQNPSPAVQDWATKTLTTLTQRHPELSTQLLQSDWIQSNESASQSFTAVQTTIQDDIETQPLDQPNRSGFTLLTETRTSNQRSTADHRGSEVEMHSEPSSPHPLISPSSHSPLSSPIPESLYQPTWRQAGRAQQWKAIPASVADRCQLVVVQMITAIALYWGLQQFVFWVAVNWSIFLTKLPFLRLSRVLFNPPELPIFLTLLGLLITSRWLLDGLLTVLYGMQPLTLAQLGNYSPETTRSLKTWCRKQRIPTPALALLPTQAPVIFSYGVVPWVARTVVSQGLLQQLADDEIATLYANEVGHLSSWTTPLMSLIVAGLQVPYTIYIVAAQWGDRQSSALLRGVAGVLASLSYGVYWLFRWPGLWLAKHRVAFGDRVAMNLTGNPNGYARALLKGAIGMAKDVQQQQQTSGLLESFDLIMPLGHRMAVPLGSLHPHTPLEPVLEWERSNPHRHWLALNNSHPLTGERLNRLMLWARRWQLDQELVWQNPISKTKEVLAQPWGGILLQGAPWWGLLTGIGLAYLLSQLGWVGMRMSWVAVSWMYNDRTLAWGLPLIGLSLGTFLRINSFFPDLPPFRANSKSVDLPSSLKNPTLIPTRSQPIRLEGRLLGRPGLANLLNQDLLLKTSQGIVRLHCTSRLGALGDLLPKPTRPAHLLKKTLTATGWLRRGATPWIDVETLNAANGQVSQSAHPIWAFIIGAIASLWGILSIFNL
jgi:Zn-dependent protease with chaperone function